MYSICMFDIIEIRVSIQAEIYLEALMQLTQFTDYALRVLIYVALKQESTSTITEIADSYGISKNHLVKVVNKLGQIDVLKTIRGNKGGIQLNIDPSQINIGKLVQQIEPHFFIVECLDRENGKCIISPVCELKHILDKAKNNFLATLSEYTLSDVVKNSAQLKKILIS
jgi:Rrf2 family transcriptional regulator, nitric oxide-sensitive transcriptional repressor